MSKLRVRGKWFVAIVGVAALALAAGIAAPSAAGEPGGNSENAKKCQKGGWQDWAKEDGTPFASQDECVSYGAQGGTLTEPVPPQQELCESYAGIYGAEDETLGPFFPVLWTCNDWSVSSRDDYLTKLGPLAEACWSSGGVGWRANYSLPPGEADFSCYTS
jgi:hypothetical protein